MQSDLSTNEYYGASTGRSKRYARTFAVLVSRHFRGKPRSSASSLNEYASLVKRNI